MIVSWFSAGCSSFVAAYLMRDKLDHCIYIDIEGQHLYNAHLTSEEIIRCRDCKWFREGASPHDPDGRYDFCTQFGFDFRGSCGFCAWAERRES